MKQTKLSYSAAAVLRDFLKGWQFIGAHSGGKWYDPSAADSGESMDQARFPYGSPVAGPNLDGLERRGFIEWTFERTPPRPLWQRRVWERGERVYKFVPSMRAEAEALLARGTR